jgi:hypothetical protein
MSDDLRRLVRLQEIMLAQEALTEKIAAVPVEIARLEKDLLAAQDATARERAALNEMQKERRRLEGELMGVESRIARYQGQLLEVKTNKEYQAMLHEIETCKSERAALDERILIEMEAQEERQRRIRGLDEALEDRRRRTAAGKADLDRLLAELRRESGTLEEERRQVASGIGPTYLDPFLKVARQRKGLALVAVRDGMCAGCHVRVMPKLVQQVRRLEGLIACDSCKRFLYVLDEPGGSAAAGNGAPASAAADGSATGGAPNGDADGPGAP